MLARERVQLGLDALDETQLRMLNPPYVSRGPRVRFKRAEARARGAAPRHQQIDWRRRGRNARRVGNFREVGVLIRIITDSVASIPAEIAKDRNIEVGVAVRAA